LGILHGRPISTSPTAYTIHTALLDLLAHHRDIVEKETKADPPYQQSSYSPRATLAPSFTCAPQRTGESQRPLFGEKKSFPIQGSTALIDGLYGDLCD
jgi:hypothetical protein